ncbi:MAG TPA: peptidylprolyl isomerase [Sphingomicrobium sp.]
MIIAILFAAAQAAASPPTPPKTPTELVAAAPASAWLPVPADDLMVIELKGGGQVIVQLAPAFAPVHVANIQALARASYWDGAAIYRVQDNYVAQWGSGESEKPFPAGVVASPPAEYHRPLAGLPVRELPYPDAYAPKAGYALGWPMAYDPAAGTANLVHCYATVGVGRGLADTGNGGELYAVIGNAPRQLDRNIAIVGRVVEGIERMSSLPRGTEALGFYKERSMDVPIASVRLASQLPEGDRPQFEYMDTAGATFAEYVRLRANRKDDFYIRPAGGVEICNAPVPVRRKPGGERG